MYGILERLFPVLVVSVAPLNLARFGVQIDVKVDEESTLLWMLHPFGFGI